MSRRIRPSQWRRAGNELRSRRTAIDIAGKYFIGFIKVYQNIIFSKLKLDEIRNGDSIPKIRQKKSGKVQIL